jgi:hypothetical protein
MRSRRSTHASARWATEAGEGVISAAIAVLVMAVIGAAMYAAFSLTMDNAQGTIDQKVAEIR